MQNVLHHVGRALAAWNRGCNHDALREFRKAARSQPRQVELWIVVGDLEQEEELYASAAKSYGRALRLMTSGRGQSFPAIPGKPMPTEATTRRSLGAVLGQAGDLDGAEVQFRRSLELANDPVTHIALGETQELTGRVEEARASFLRALRMQPGHVEALYRLGCVHMWTQPHRAERYMRKVIQRDKKHALALSSLGLLLGMRESYDEADRLLRRAGKAGGAGALPHVYRGHHLLHRGRSEEALEAYRDGFRAAPGDPHPLFAVGDLHRQEGRDDEARAAYEDALRLDPRCGDAALRLGYLHEDEGRAEEAIRYFRQGLELAPQHPWAHDVRGALRRLAP